MGTQEITANFVKNIRDLYRFRGRERDLTWRFFAFSQKIDIPEVSLYVFLFTFFLCSSFSPRWPLAFLIFSPPLQNFMLILQQKMPPLFVFYLALALFLVELRWPVALLSIFLCLSLPLFSKFVDMTINLKLILYTTGYRNRTIFAFRFRLYWLFSCLCFTKREQPYAFAPK